MTNIIKVKRGLKANLPNITLQVGEPAFTTDDGKFYVGDGVKKVLINPTYGSSTERDVGTSPGNIPEIGVDGKLDSSILPSIAITDVFEVSSQAQMLALNVQPGDIAIRTDENKCYILGASPASVLANWKLLRTPTDLVLSVAGKTGIVTLTKSDVGLSNVTNESKATMFTNPAFTGIPTSPTAPTATNNTQIATTAFVKAQGYLTMSDIENLSIDGGEF